MSSVWNQGKTTFITPSRDNNFRSQHIERGRPFGGSRRKTSDAVLMVAADIDEMRGMLLQVVDQRIAVAKVFFIIPRRFTGRRGMGGKSPAVDKIAKSDDYVGA